MGALSLLKGTWGGLWINGEELHPDGSRSVKGLGTESPMRLHTRSGEKAWSRSIKDAVGSHKGQGGNPVHSNRRTRFRCGSATALSLVPRVVPSRTQPGRLSFRADV